MKSTGLRSHWCFTVWCLNLANASFLMLIAVPYGLWLNRGCCVFLPFISDFGMRGEMRLAFTVLIDLVAFFFMCAVPGIWKARRNLIRRASKLLVFNITGHIINFLSTASAVCILVAAASLPFYPWDRRLMAHLRCCVFLFIGGLAWLLSSIVLSCCWRRGNCISKSGLSICLCAAGYVGAAFLMINFFSHGYREKPELAENFQFMLQAAAEDFDSYCRGHKAWHTSFYMNLAAAMEWLALTSLVVSVSAVYVQTQKSLASLDEMKAPLRDPPRKSQVTTAS